MAQKTDMARVAVVILNWNGEKLLQEFLPSVIENTNRDLGRVVVVDNHSDDASLKVLEKEFPDVEVLPFEQNYGFAGGYNRAIDRIDAEFIVLLNSDVAVTPGWLEPLIELLDAAPDVAAVQPKIKAYTARDKFEYAGACGGYIDRYGFPFCRGRIMDTTEEDRGQYDEVADLFWCSGAALCIRRKIYIECGGLDERFFAHMEEIDLCWRVRNRGWRLQVNPVSVVYHLGGGSLPMNHPRKLFLNYRNNLLMLYKNLDPENLKHVLRVRKLLDFIAACMFLLKGQLANVRSISAAYTSFREMKKEYISGGIKKEDPCIYRKSIVLAYFVRRIKNFSDLHFLR